VTPTRTEFPNFSTTRLLLPQAAIEAWPKLRDEVVPALNRGLLTVGAGVSTTLDNDCVHVYAGPADIERELKNLGSTQVLLVYVATGSGALRQAGVLRGLVDLPAKGVLPVLVMGAENAGRGFEPSFGTKMLHRLFETTGEDRPALRILIDLGAVPAFYQTQDAALDFKSPEYQQQILGGFEAGLRQLRDVLQSVAEANRRKKNP